MRHALAALLAALLLAGCSSDSAGDEPAAQQTTASSAASSSAAAPSSDEGDVGAFLVDVRTGGLIGTYLDADLVTVGQAFCAAHRSGQDMSTPVGTPNGDGTLQFEGVATPVWAVDTISIDFSAQEYLCPDTIGS